jgi:Ribbon-helix-helix domain
MATATTRWNLVVPKQTDKDLRQLLASEGRSKKGELSRFVTEAVNRQIFDAAHQAVMEKNANVPPEEIEAAVEESLAWARARMRR